eukprot:scaffold74151_cov54-Attheya_sp.AAC.2
MMFLCSWVTQQRCVLEACQSCNRQEQMADMFTKNLTEQKFLAARKQLSRLPYVVGNLGGNRTHNLQCG